jgi:hypothetical protein
MKRILGRVALVVTLACAAEPSRAPMEWASVHPEAIAAWKDVNHAPDGVAVDSAAHAVRILVEATGLSPADTAEFFAIGPLSDRAYESFFVTVASPAAIADAIERAGVPRGVPPDIAGARLWPCGEKLTLSAMPVSTNAPGAARSSATAISFSDLLNDAAEKEETAILSAPVVYTGGARDASGAVVAATNIPCAVFALYSHTPSLLQLNGQFDQSTAYGRFRAKKAWPAGSLFELTLRWDGRTTVLRRDVELTVPTLKEKLTALRADAAAHDLFVRMSFGEGVTVGEAAEIAQALSLVDGKGLKMDGPMPGQFFFRAFLPDPAWRARPGRLFQPFEVHVAAGGAKKFVFVEEDWSGEGLDPVLKPKETPFAEWAELPKLIAQTGEKGAKINVLFLFAPKATPVSALTPAVSALGDRIGTYYIFGE